MLTAALDNKFEFYKVGLESRMFVLRMGRAAAGNGDLRLESDIYSREKSTRPLC